MELPKDFILIPILFVCLAASARDYDLAIADIDLDGVTDSVRIDRIEGVIICKLSRKGFEPQKSVPTESLTGEGFIHNLSLSARQGLFQLAFLGNRAANHFIFIYDKRRKNIYLREHWAETLGDINGNEASTFEHDVLRGRVYYSIRYYGGSMNADEYEKDNYFTNTTKKRVPKIRIKLQEFSDQDYYNRTKYIWDEL